MEPNIEFHNFFEDVLDPMPADKTAMGSLPASGFQYCEALTAASSHGYYVFPPKDATIRWNGDRFELLDDDDWCLFESIGLSEEAQATWQEVAPDAHKKRLPPFLQRFFLPDTIQVFTGLFVTCATDWAIKIRPIANVKGPMHFLIYEGIVEADLFQPLPLFFNLKALSIGATYFFEKYTPLLQVEPVPKASLRKGLAATRHPARENDVNFPWDGLTSTTRIFTGEASELELGEYKRRVRSKAKKRHRH